jgi:galactokinase
MKKIIPFLEKIYGSNDVSVQRQLARYCRINNNFSRRFGNQPSYVFSTPGRTELGGNHTDHNHGRVLAASINLDIAAVAAESDNMTVTVHSEGYDQPFVVDLNDLSVHENEHGTTDAIIRGVAAGLNTSNYAIGGFNAMLTSDVLPGSGLSSSAAVEVLFGTIFNTFFNGGIIPSEEIAKIGQYSENNYFGKPCGLMDQIASAVGGTVAIDFQNPKSPKVEKLDFDFTDHSFSLIIVDTGGDHLDLTDDYARIPAEMEMVTQFLGAKTLREISHERLISEIPKLRKITGDRAILRAVHFFEENERVSKQVHALRNNDLDCFLHLARISGSSSIKWLQNAYSTRDVRSQGMPLALALTEKYLAHLDDVACRVHGGGFAGAIQVILPTVATEEYVAYIEDIFGDGSARVLGVRPYGTCFFNTEGRT